MHIWSIEIIGDLNSCASLHVRSNSVEKINDRFIKIDGQEWILPDLFKFGDVIDQSCREEMLNKLSNASMEQLFEIKKLIDTMSITIEDEDEDEDEYGDC